MTAEKRKLFFLFKLPCGVMVAQRGCTKQHHVSCVKHT